MQARYPDCDNVAESTAWFMNSYHDILLAAEKQEITEPDLVDKLYEETYGVKLIIDTAEWVTQVEFPSDEEALLFIVRWS